MAAIAIVIARDSAPSAPASDIAVIESYAHLAQSSLVEVGPYSRFGWHHPGPAFFYAAAPFYALSGNRTAGLQASALTINVLAIAVLLWSLVLAGERSIALGAALSVSIFVWRVPELLTSPWNPHVLILPTLALIGVSAAVAAGAIGLLPLAVGIASFVTQTHVGLAPTVLVVMGAVLMAVTDLFVRSNVARERARIRIAVVLSVAVAIVVWSLPLHDQLFHESGNLGEIWRFFVFQSHRTQPGRTAYQAWLTVYGSWITPGFTLASGVPLVPSRAGWLQAWGLGQLVLLLLVAIWSFVSERRATATLSGLLLLASIVAMWSISRIEETVMDHEVFWMSALGCLTSFVLLAALILDPIVSRLTRRSMALQSTVAMTAVVSCAVALVSVAGLGLSVLHRDRDRWAAQRPDGVAIVAMSTELEHAARAGQWVRPLFLFDQVAWEGAAGVLLQLQKAGIDFAIERDWLPMYTRASAPIGNESPVIALSGRERHLTLVDVPGVRPIAAHGSLYADLVPSAASVPAAP